MPEIVPIRKTPSIIDQLMEMQDRITRRAYEIFEQNGGASDPLGNWAQAERELVWAPALEVSEKDGRFQIEVATAGLDPGNIEIQATPEDIVLKAEIRHEHNESKGTVHYCEFQTGRMFRRIQLPKRINTDKVRAEMKNGLLRLTAEVADEARARTIKPEAA